MPWRPITATSWRDAETLPPSNFCQSEPMRIDQQDFLCMLLWLSPDGQIEIFTKPKQLGWKLDADLDTLNELVWIAQTHLGSDLCRTSRKILRFEPTTFGSSS